MIENLVTNYKASLNEVYLETTTKFQGLPWENKEFYAEWLAQTYFMVSHTPRFICLAAARFSIQDDNLHRQMINHFSDEDEHEYILIQDLKNLGFDIKDFHELPETSLIIQQLYHQIDRVDPTAIYGRILFLELLTAELDAAFSDRITDSYRMDQSKFMHIHLQEDIGHVRKAAQIINKVDPSKHRIIGDSFYMTGYLYQQFLDGISKKFKRSQQTPSVA